MEGQRWQRVLVGCALAAPVAVVLVVAWPDDAAPERRDPPAELEVDQGEIGPDSEVEVDVPAQGAVVFVVVGIGGPVTMRVEGDGFDSTLTVVDADGDQLAYNDDTDGLDPQVQFDLEVDEELTVEVRSFGGMPGEVVVVREDDPE